MTTEMSITGIKYNVNFGVNLPVAKRRTLLQKML